MAIRLFESSTPAILDTPAGRDRMIGWVLWKPDLNPRQLCRRQTAPYLLINGLGPLLGVVLVLLASIGLGSIFPSVSFGYTTLQVG